MSGVYLGREQTKAKHFILRTYLQALSFKVLNGPNGWPALSYVDGFSGPWKTRTKNHADSSFMIAIEVLKEAQNRIFELTGVRKTIRCFFSENNRTSYSELVAAVAAHNDVKNRFHITTFEGEFEIALPQIDPIIDGSFALFFIDPTGWTGYSLETLAPYLRGRGREVLINFMYDHINRFAASPDEKTIESMNPILGGAGWTDRLDPDLPRGLAVEKLFRETLQEAGDFEHVLSTRIDKSTTDRPHFFLAYGTKALAGLKAFRDAEYGALKENDKDRALAKRHKNNELEGTDELFGNEDLGQRTTIDDLIAERRALAAEWARNFISANGGEASFDDICAEVMRSFMLRETNVKDVCLDLCESGTIEKTWEKRKPKSGDHICLTR